MMHSRIEHEDIVERYVRHQLPPADEQAFDEHLLGCDECFEKVQAFERFHAGINDAAARGRLAVDVQVVSERRSWLPWAFALTTCTTAASAAIAAWLYFAHVPALRTERDRASAQLASQQGKPAAEAPLVTLDRIEANVALVILQASRTGDRPATAVLTPASRQLLLWIDLEPSRYRRFRVDLVTLDDRPIASVDQLERNAYGALVASLPVGELPEGNVRATLTGQDPPPAAVVNQYQLTIQRR